VWALRCAAVLFYRARYVPEFANLASPRVDLPSPGLLLIAVLPITDRAQ
jgi:hypothetical protein